MTRAYASVLLIKALCTSSLCNKSTTRFPRLSKTSQYPFNTFHSKRSPRQRVSRVRLSAQTQLRLVSSTVYLTGKPEIEVQLALTRLLTSAGATMGINPLVRNGNSSIVSRHDNTRRTRRVDNSLRKTHGDRPTTILEKTRASLLGRDVEESPRGQPAVSAAFQRVRGASVVCVSMINQFGSLDCVKLCPPPPIQPRSQNRRSHGNSIQEKTENRGK